MQTGITPLLPKPYKVELIKLEHFGNLFIRARAEDTRND
jgi:hypothetical protein